MNDHLRTDAIKVFPEDAMVRMGTDGEELGYVNELLVASFHHTENRSEPYKHWHVDVLNIAMGEDGKLYSLRNDLICNSVSDNTTI